MASAFIAVGPATVVVDMAANVVVSVLAGDLRGQDPDPGHALVYVDAPLVHAGAGDVPQADGTYLTPPAAVAVPTQVTTRQFVIEAQATTLPGASQTLWATIKAMLTANVALDDVFWASATISRQDPMFLGAAGALGIDSATQDAFFAAAAAR